VTIERHGERSQERRRDRGAPGLDGDLTEALIRTRRSSPGPSVPGLRTLHQIGGRGADAFYRDRWSHDKVVRSTHGVNCTGSCSWKVYVKDGIITWESQQTDYPSVGPDRPSTSPAAARAGRVLLVHLLADPGALPVRPRRLLQTVPRGEGRARRTRSPPGPTSSSTPSGPASVPSRRVARQGRPGSRATVGRKATELVRRHDARVHDQDGCGPDPGSAGLLAVHAMSMVSHASGARFYTSSARDAVVLRLVRRPAGRLPAGVRRPRPTCPSPATGGTRAT
jgi:nitrate reductase alpha subunit